MPYDITLKQRLEKTLIGVVRKGMMITPGRKSPLYGKLPRDWGPTYSMEELLLEWIGPQEPGSLL